MNDFITVAVFTLPTEMFVAKAKLESEDIRCRVLDELTVQSYNFISNAIGGIKLQVASSDIVRARTILEDGGFIMTEESEPSYIEKLLHNPRTIGRVKIIFYVLFAIIALIVLFYIMDSLKS